MGASSGVNRAKVSVNRSRMARELGVDLAHISRIWSGKARPSLGLAKRMAENMGITLDELCQRLGVDGERLSEEGKNGEGLPPEDGAE